MKRHVLRLVRSAGLLRHADRLFLLRSRWRSRHRNRSFVQANPGFVMPPADLAFDAYNHVDRLAYLELGCRHAQVFAQAIVASGVAAAAAGPTLSILEWGCGPGRIIRHMRDCLPDRDVMLTGTDVNARSIAWCAEHIPGVAFAVNDFLPPLPFADGSFDVAYCFSVFTHLSEPVQHAWAQEMLRVLKPGGVLICSTHGDWFSGRLAQGRQEAERYGNGEMVVQGRYEEGKKWFLALHPPSYVRDKLLAPFEDVRALTVPPEGELRQDLWIARKPSAAAAA